MPANFPTASFEARDVANSVELINRIITGQQANERAIFSNQTSRMQAETEQRQEARLEQGQEFAQKHQPFEDMLAKMKVDQDTKQLEGMLAHYKQQNLLSNAQLNNLNLQNQRMEYDNQFYGDITNVFNMKRSDAPTKPAVPVITSAPQTKSGGISITANNTVKTSAAIQNTKMSSNPEEPAPGVFVEPVGAPRNAKEQAAATIKETDAAYHSSMSSLIQNK